MFTDFNTMPWVRLVAQPDHFPYFLKSFLVHFFLKLSFLLNVKMVFPAFRAAKLMVLTASCYESSFAASNYRGVVLIDPALKEINSISVKH